MTVELLANPTEPVVDDDGSYEGYAEIARLLSKTQPYRERPYSRQLVHKWYQKRAYNGFPRAYRVRVESGKIKTMFKMADVMRWHDKYRVTHLPPIETIPLFSLNDQGAPVC